MPAVGAVQVEQIVDRSVPGLQRHTVSAPSLGVRTRATPASLINGFESRLEGATSRRAVDQAWARRQTSNCRAGLLECDNDIVLVPVGTAEARRIERLD